MNIMCRCGREILGQVVEGKLVIYDRRHSERHEVIVDLLQLVTQYRQQGGSIAPLKAPEMQAARQPSNRGAVACAGSSGS